ncbi:hypothetical protein [Agreia bicolorata]|uniref:Uncharacterized protein n=1 Tax=Agreia bicolorata TaxID=110935 RepID=A0ABR5CE12_9MICO|nr:hypothetical protein [Agreia bicolorata]KJC63801.1 hypothetical protein TZ00_12215 [Agreia bicolorata]
MSYVPNELLARLVGFRMYSVNFVMDRLQLGFDSNTDDEPFLNCDVWPEVTFDGEIFREPDRGYADALRRLIPSTVLETREGTGLGLVLVFERGSIKVHPKVEDVYVEIAMLSGFTDREWMVWRPGEESFEDLGV